MKIAGYCICCNEGYTSTRERCSVKRIIQGRLFEVSVCDKKLFVIIQIWSKISPSVCPLEL